MRSLVLFLLMAVLAGCGAVASVSTPSQPEEAFRPGVPLAEMLDSTLDTRALLDRMNEPRRIETEAVENRHVPGQVDTLRTYVYDGLALTVYDVTGGGPLLLEIRVTGEGYVTAEGLRLGSTHEEIAAVYTGASSAHDDRVTYERTASADDPTPETLQVRFDGERAAELVWSFYVD